ncbi:ABC transporter ATP-binding protein [Selenomonas ruminantium]|uniref:ABC transporter ATP-binding protein n=1 Tax=Selenomonas ruminantium TaxID=971 RepID=UPI00068AD9E0|nr:ABC transporter ATP-binding protein [Selenomonas ruminantium]
MSNDWAIKIDHLSKVYKIFDKPTDRVKEALNPFKKRYSKDFYALNDVSLTIKKGETVGIIGKNGAGKSTLLKIITGVLTPTAGNIQVNGRIASLLELGAGFNPEMSGIENVYMNGTIMGYTKEEMDERLQDIIDFADIGDFINQPVKMYSSGMFARLAFAVNAFVEPDVLIVDEALSVGDAFFQNKCFKKFEELKESNVTVIYVSHDIGSIRRFCDKVLWLERGSTRKYSESDDVCSDYLDMQIKANELYAEAEKLSDDRLIRADKQSGKIIFPELNATKAIKTHPEDGKIVSFFITDMNDKLTSSLDAGSKYKFHIVAEFYNNIKNVIFGINFDTQDGLPLIGFNTYLSSKCGIDVNENSVVDAVMVMEIPIIKEGKYLLSPAIAKGTQNKHSFIEYLPICKEVQVYKEGPYVALLEVNAECEFSSYDRENVSYK